MKKALIVSLYVDGSCPKFTKELYIGLSSYCETSLLIPGDIENRQELEKIAGIDNIGYLNVKKGSNIIFSKIKKYTNIVKFLIFKNKQIKKILSQKYDMVFYTFFHRWNNIILKVVNTDNNILFLHDPIPHSGEKKNRFKKQYNQVRKMDKIIVLSKKFTLETAKIYNFDKNKIIYIPHFLLKYNNTLPKRTSYVVNEPINFLFFGRIEKYKGINILLEAYKLIENKKYNSTLRIFGSGDFSEYANKAALLSSVFVENRYIDEKEIPDIFLERNTVVVLPYVDATQSGVIAIAYEFGCPVIATNTGGLLEQLDDGKIGYYCKPNDANSLFLALEYFIKNPTILFNESNKIYYYGEKLDSKNIVAELLKKLKF